MNDDVMLHIADLAKAFHLHASQARIPVFGSLDFEVGRGECVVLSGPSGTGKSTLIRSIYGNYQTSAGSIHIRHDGELIDVTTATARTLLEIRRHTLGYVSQFLRVIPRISTLDLVMEPLLDRAVDPAEAEQEARDILRQLNLPEAHWHLPPATFSGGEQQRVNIARGFIRKHPILLLDEPTASLDAANRDVVVAMIKAALDEGIAMVGIFHDEEMRDAVATRVFDVSAYGYDAA